jgi:5'-3' exonuclease
MNILLIDLSHVFWTTHHGLGSESNMTAEHVVQRVLGMREGYDAVVVCLDVGKSFRKYMYPDYKSGRPEKDPAALDQLRRVKEKLEADGLPCVGADGYEADDIIATLAVQAAGRGYETTIATGDKDLLQLVGGPIRVLSTNPKGTMMGEVEVKEKFGVPPSQLVDLLSLMGDKSDAIPGCPGCGQVNAARLLTELGSLDNMYEEPAGITPPRMRDLILQYKEQILFGRKLIRLHAGAPVDFEESITPKERKMTETEEVPDATTSTVQPSHVERETGNQAPVADVVASDISPSRSQVTTAIVLDKQSPDWMLALEPRDIRQLSWFANRLYESQLYRKFPNADAIMAVVLKGRSMGIDMLTSLDCFNVIKGKPCIGAMAMVGVVLASGKAEYFEPIELGLKVATWRTKRVGRPEVVHSYAIEEAEAAGLTKPSDKGEPSNYVKRPKPMLSKQCAVELARMIYPDIVANLYSPEEIDGT